jgi:hypothetical protein
MSRESYYGKRLQPKLRELINLARGSETPADRLALGDELDLIRTIAAAQLDTVLQRALDPNEKEEVRIGNGELAKKILADVASVAQKAAQVRSLAVDAATVDDIEFVINQVLGVIKTTVEPVDPILAASITHQIENIKMPGRNRDLPNATQLLNRAVAEIAEVEKGTST